MECAILSGPSFLIDGGRVFWWLKVLIILYVGKRMES